MKWIITLAMIIGALKWSGLIAEKTENEVFLTLGILVGLSAFETSQRNQQRLNNLESKLDKLNGQAFHPNVSPDL